MTREEKVQAENMMLAGYEHLGATLVSDDAVLGSLLRALVATGVTSDDEDVDAYLRSFLAA